MLDFAKKWSGLFCALIQSKSELQEDEHGQFFEKNDAALYRTTFRLNSVIFLHFESKWKLKKAESESS